MIQVVDALCGAGKTRWVFSHLREQYQSGSDNKYIFVSPYLDEVGDGTKKGRIQKELPDLRFVSPAANPSKTQSFARYVNQGRNVAITHSLFSMITKETLEAIEKQNYHLIIDETIDLVSILDQVSPSDVDMLVSNGYVVVEESNQIVWNTDKYPKYKGAFSEIKELADDGCLWLYGSEVFILRVPPTMIRSCKSTTILTYMFKSSLMCAWFQLNNLEWSYYYPEGLEEAAKLKQNIRDCIHIIEPPKYIKDLQVYSNGMPRHNTFNVTWYSEQLKSDEGLASLDRIRKSIEITLKDKMHKGPTFWTTFKDYRTYLQGKGYSRKRRGLEPFLAKNVRASNAYMDYTNCIYTINIYAHGTLKSHLASCGVIMDEDGIALSELIQFAFRGAVRKNEEMCLYILSDRMRRLFEDWMKTDT